MVRITTVLHGCVRVERSFSTAFPFFLTRQEDPPRLNGLEEVAVERLLRYTRVLDRWSGSVGTFPRELPLYQRRGVATPSSGFLHSIKNFHTGAWLVKYQNSLTNTRSFFGLFGCLWIFVRFPWSFICPHNTCKRRDNKRCCRFLWI